MTSLWDALVEPVVRYGFMRYGLVVAVIVGVTSAVLSCLLVVRRWALMGDAIAHAVLLGVALGWIAARQVGVFWGALTAGVLTGLAIAYVERNSRVKLDAAMGIVFTFAFALGLAIISVVRPRGIDLFHVLLGNVLGVGPGDLALTAVSGGLVLAVVVALFRGFHLWTFDPLVARAAGVPTGALHYLLTALLSATIVASLQAVGLVLVIALLITPGATAYLLTDRLAAMMRIAAVLGLVASVGGLYGSYYLNVASGPAIVIVASLLFLAAFAFAPKRGVLARRLRRARRARETVAQDVLKAVVTAEEEAGAPVSVETLTGRFGRSPREVDRAVRRLGRQRLLTADASGLRSSAAGRQAGLGLVRTHRLLERYLWEAEGRPLDELHAEAEELEHRVDADQLDVIDQALGRPDTDPHGHPIPTPAGVLARIAGRPLTEALDGQSGRVTMVRDDQEDLLASMVELGIVPQGTVTVLGRRDGQLRVRIGEREAELTREVAERVFVVPMPASQAG